jgi:hypothetical protein
VGTCIDVLPPPSLLLLLGVGCSSPGLEAEACPERAPIVGGVSKESYLGVDDREITELGLPSPPIQVLSGRGFGYRIT